MPLWVCCASGVAEAGIKGSFRRERPIRRRDPGAHGEGTPEGVRGTPPGTPASSCAEPCGGRLLGGRHRTDEGDGYSHRRSTLLSTGMTANVSVGSRTRGKTAARNASGRPAVCGATSHWMSRVNG